MRRIAFIGLVILASQHAVLSLAQGMKGGPFDGASMAVVTCGVPQEFNGGSFDGASMAVITCGAARVIRGSAFDGANVAVATCGAVRAIRGSASDGANMAVVTCGAPRTIAGGGCNGDHMAISKCVGEVYVTETCITPALPVELLDLGARCEPGGVLIWWITGSELNSDRFVVERAQPPSEGESIDEGDWQEVGTVVAAGHSQQAQAYSFFDDFARSTLSSSDGAVYHRVAQVDADGTIVHFPITATAYPCGGDHAIMLYPVPARHTLHMRSSAPLDGITISDALGHAVLFINAVKDQATLDIALLAPGAYTLEGRHGAGASYARFVVER